MCKFIAERIITCQCTNENLGNSLTKRDFRLQSGNLVYKMRFSFTKRDSWVTNGTLALHFTMRILEQVIQEETFDIEVQYCDPDECLHDCMHSGTNHCDAVVTGWW